MKQQNSRMIAEVNKLIGNSLIKDGGVYLPEIGSLSITTTPPSMGGVRGEATAPRRTVAYSNDEKYRSLVLTISERGNCTPQQATLIYNKWREVSVSNSRVNIDGVGMIFEETFTPSPTIESKLNPVTIKPVTNKTATVKPAPTKSTEQTATMSNEKKVTATTTQKPTNPAKPTKPTKPAKPATTKSEKRSGGKANGKGIGIAIALGVAAAVGLFIILSPAKEQNTQLSKGVKSEEIVAEKPAAQPIAQPAKAEVEAETRKVVEQKATPKVEPKQQQQPKKPQPVQTDRSTNEIFQKAFKAGQANQQLPYKVVYGAFSTEENVAKAITLAEKTLGSSINCTAYRHGKSYIVSLLDTDSEQEARAFINKHKGSIKESLWIHKR